MQLTPEEAERWADMGRMGDCSWRAGMRGEEGEGVEEAT